MKYQTTEEAYAAGIEAGRKIERSECWDEINRHIKRGKLDGNGCDATAQNNGMVLAANLLMERIQVKTPNLLIYDRGDFFGRVWDRGGGAWAVVYRGGGRWATVL